MLERGDIECFFCGADLLDHKPEIAFIRLDDRTKELNICTNCEEKVREKDLFAPTKEDLQGLPYTEFHWKCFDQYCNNKARIRDYGVRPYFLWGKRWVNPKQTVYCCSKHWPLVKKEVMEVPDDDYYTKNILPIKSKSL